MNRQSPASFRVHLPAVLVASLLAASAGPASAQSRGDALLFDDSVLQRVELRVNQRDWDTLRERYTQNTYYPADLVWRGQTVRNVGIRSRGSGTRNGVKPGLLIDFDRYVQGQRFLGLKALVLDNHLQDPSGMREALTMSVLRRFGLPAPREAHAEVHVNGEFFGVYSIVENIDSVATARLFPISQLAPRRVVGLRPERGDREPLPDRVPPSGTTPAPEPPPGYLFEYNWLDYYYETYLGFDLEPYAEMFDAETRDDEPVETLYRPIETLFREINEAPAADFAARVGVHLDLPLYVQVVAVEAFMADWDGVAGDFGANNFYLFRQAAGGPHKIIAWDTDNSFHSTDYRVDAAQDKHVLVRRIMQVPELRRLYLDTLERVAQLVELPDARGLGPGWLEREIARRAGLLRARTAEDRVSPHSPASVDNGIAFNLEFARRRASVVREQARQSQQGER